VNDYHDVNIRLFSVYYTTPKYTSEAYLITVGNSLIKTNQNVPL